MSKVFQLFQDAFSRLATAVDSPLAHRLFYCVRSDPDAVKRVSINPMDYTCPQTFANDYLLLSLCKKYKGLGTSVNKKSVALASWMKQEGINCQTNHRLLSGLVKPEVSAVLYIARQKIAKLLGDFDEQEMFDMADFGKGATFSIKRKNAQIDIKASHLPITITEDCLPYFRRLLRSDIHFAESFSMRRTRAIEFDIVPGNRHDTVPKTAFTDRNIAVEPLANSFLQKGVGKMIRKRLKSVGIDLNDQSRNQGLAEMAYKSKLATIDLSNASDSVSYAIVEELLPQEWFDVLDDLRSKRTLINEQWQLQQKFSSMGNGFTFELESLIFYALSYACRSYVQADGPIGIFGDDIIVSNSYSGFLVEVLSECGFEVNTEKSYHGGFFFESCGKHYFKGCDVTPVYQKELVATLPEIIRFHNRLYRWHRKQWYSLEGLSPILRDLRLHAPEYVIPDVSESDDGFLRPRHKLNLRFDPNRGWHCKVLVPTTVKFPANDLALLAVALRRRMTSFGGFVELPLEFYVTEMRWVSAF
ncbi:RNA-directed RNA polymerase [ssRNA phage SRR6253161_1]|uniref:RNA-directed RNA polymerase n=1 Tax=ssRNA phage SRR6253161_1 TaxID=2786488 RepID=A0A8S5L1F1_9VIRU|nr:RNA-directed RNA polymerase [ssRNA phage SRR6253161_1]DAD50938.1 TPA_asm: RNA-directed RNA polymerase [ssRNA phage SRR6253161_1]